MKFGSQIDTQKIPVKGLVAESGGTAPAAPVTGQQWTDTSTVPPVLKVWNGTAWIRANGADLPDGTVTDAKVATGAAISLAKLAVDPLARGNHTGTQTAATISNLATVVQGYRLDQFAAPTGPLALGGQRATGGGAPVQPADLATKQYVDDARAGIAGVKDPVRVAAPGSVNLAAPGATIDGVTMAAGDRFLAPAQTTGTENGIYVYNGAATAATRAADADAVGEIADGTLVAVAEGTRAGTQYIQQAVPSGAPGAWTQSWTVYTTSGTTYLAGAGMTLTGSTFDVVAADASISVGADAISVGLVPVSKGGTGATTAAQARANLGVGGRYAADLPALTAGNWTNITHGLGTTDIAAPSVREVASGEFLQLDARVVDANTVAVRADVAYSAGALRIAVMS